MRVSANHLLKMNDARRYRSFWFSKFFKSFNDLYYEVRVEFESCMSRVESESKCVGLESESNKIGTRVRLMSESKDSSPHLWMLEYNLMMYLICIKNIEFINLRMITRAGTIQGNCKNRLFNQFNMMAVLWVHIPNVIECLQKRKQIHFWHLRLRFFFSLNDFILYWSWHYGALSAA